MPVTRTLIAPRSLATLTGVALFAAGTVLGTPTLAARAAGGVSVDRVLHDARIAESSGLLASTAHPGVLWTHNDSGNPPLLYAVGRNGRTLATVRVTRAADVDWEALAPARGQDGTPLLAVADLGDNSASRAHIEIDVVPEPDPLRTVREQPVRTLRLRYPDGAVDAETLLVDPRSQRMFIVTKGLLGSTVYAVPTDAWPGTAAAGGSGSGRTAGPSRVDAVLQRVGDVPLSLVTDGCVLPDGRVLLRTYSTLMLLPALPSTATARGGHLSALNTVALPDQQQGEGLTLLDAKAGVIALSSEGRGQPVLRMRLPATFWRAGAPNTSTTPGASGAARNDDSSGNGGNGGTNEKPSGDASERADGDRVADGAYMPPTANSNPATTRSARVAMLALLALLVIGIGVGAGKRASRRRRRRLRRTAGSTPWR